MMANLILRRSALVAALMLSACGDSEPPTPPNAPAYATEVIEQNNRAVGLMGYFDYPGAYNAFSELHQAHPDETVFAINLAIATLNRQLDGDEATALADLQQLAAAEPDNAQVRYLAGLLLIRKGDATAALKELSAVTSADPSDAYAWYFFGQAQELNNDYAGALNSYQKAAEQDPYLRSAYYASFVIQRRLRKRDEAKANLDIYQRLADNPRAQLAEFKYTRMGPKAEVVVVGEPAKAAAPGAGPLFASAQTLLSGLTIHSEQPGITVADINADGVLDVFINGAATDKNSHNTVLLGKAGGGYSNDTDHPLVQIEGVTAALWGDLNNDGLIDAYFCRNGANQLWRQSSDQGWTDASKPSAATGNANSIDGLMFDADHDGDLDIYVVNADSPSELWNNNLDGTFRPLAADQNIGGSARGAVEALALDIDNDRDTDIIVINQNPPHDVYINDRLWAYQQGKGFDALRNAWVAKAVAADVDADGHTDLLTSDASGELSLWQQGEQGVWQPSALGSVAAGYLAAQDLTGNGVSDLFAADQQGWAVHAATTVESLHAAPQSGLRAFSLLNANPAKGPGLLTLNTQGALHYHPPGNGRQPFLSMTFSGLENDADSMRSNASGIGTRVAVRVGPRWSLTDTFRHHTGPGQSLQPLSIGLGGANKADFIALTWSDGVFQSELGLKSGELHAITETQRQLSSCPVLFAWDGQKYQFISDILGVGGMGYMVAPGQYAPPRPHENYLMPAGLPKPRGDNFEIKIGEPMEEAAYLDAVRLVSYDLPPGWAMVLDERMGISGTKPSGEAIFYREERLPKQARMGGEDVTKLVLERDLQAPDVGEFDRRFIGRLQEPYSVIVEFDRPIADGLGKPVLVADGWVEYPYSQTTFGAWQAGAEFNPPSLEARDADGNWQMLAKQFGYPAGMPRRMALPLPELPADSTALRLSTNQEVYWDRLSIIYAEAKPDVQRNELPLSLAKVSDVGFAKRSTGIQRQPHYDYSDRSPLWDTRHQKGYYTAFGTATELVSAADDAVAIIGPGEELHLEYRNTLPKLADGWQRQFVVESHGWAKDLDMFTNNGATIGPLPSTGKPRDVVEQLHARYNTRLRSGH